MRKSKFNESQIPGAAARQPRPGAAPHVLAEVQQANAVPFRRVYLTGKLTYPVRNWRPPK